MGPSRPVSLIPPFERLSTIVAAILIAYTLARFITVPDREIAVQLPGIYLVVNLDSHFVVAILVACLAAAGADWLLHDHPVLAGGRTLEHWLIPTLTSLIISFPLSQLRENPLWWIALPLGGSLIILVFLAEYIVIDPDDMRYYLAAIGLTLLSFSIYLVLTSALRYTQTRLFLLLPVLAIASGLVSLRALHLRMQNRRAYLQAGIVTLVTVQFGAAIHYWPLSPVTFGLILLGVTYASTILVGNLVQNKPYSQAIIEPLVMLIIIWGAAYWMR